MNALSPLVLRHPPTSRDCEKQTLQFLDRRSSECGVGVEGLKEKVEMIRMEMP